MKEYEWTVTLMMDEIHVQPFFFFNFKGGFITGAAVNKWCPAKTAHVFMKRSLLSSDKDVHIPPVAQIEAIMLHYVLRKLIVNIESLGFKVIAVISDNNSINRKTMQFFANLPNVSIAYQHLVDSSRPLFFILDLMHILKPIRNNWLNQKNSGRCMYFPDPTSDDEKPPILTASFKALRDMHEAEHNERLKLVKGAQSDNLRATRCQVGAANFQPLNSCSPGCPWYSACRRNCKVH